MINNGSSPRGISWHQPPRSGGSAGGGGRRVRPGRSQILHLQQQQNHDRPHDEVLDSSSSGEEEEDEDERRWGECGDQCKIIGKSTVMSASGEKTPKSEWQHKNHFDADGGETEAFSEASDDDDDEQFMNPYVMKPHFQLNSHRSTALNPPPPSMELASIMSWRSSSSTTTTQTSTKKTSNASTRQASSALMGFDPYSPGRDLQQQRQQEHPRYPLQQHLLPQHHQNSEMELEMEADESTIDFTGYGQQQRTPFESNDDFDHLFGDSHRASTYRDEDRGEVISVEGHDYIHATSYSASFSPIPKQQQRYGERTPLFGNSSSMTSSSWSGAPMPDQFLSQRGPIFNARTPSSSAASSSGSVIGGQWGARVRQQLPTIFSGASNAILSVLYYSSRTASILLGGERNGNKDYNTNNNTRMPLLSSSRFPEKNRHGKDIRRTSRWGTIHSFRLVLVAMTTILCMRTMSIMLWSLPSETEMSSTTAIAPDDMTITEQHQQKQDTEQQQIIVNKMKKAKAHWWSRKKVEAYGGSSSASSSENTQQQQDVMVVVPHAEVYRNGENVQTIIPKQRVIEEGNHVAMDATESSKEDEHPPAAVIVQTEEDGSILIKLPPPKLSLEEPEFVFGSTNSDSDNADDTMYIKLPYKQRQNAAGDVNDEMIGATKREIEPPLRGAAPMVRHPPPPLAEHEHHHYHGLGGKHLQFDEHEHPGVLHVLRKEFGTWMSKHGKQYGTKKEEDHRFNVWRTNHARIAKKNERHGPCRLTGKAVFGHNLFSDLDPEEFKSRFLKGYRGPRHSDEDGKGGGGGGDASLRHSYFRDVKRVAESPSPLPGASRIERHPTIQRKLDEVIAKYGVGGFGEEGSSSNSSRLHGTKFQSNYGSCSNWWDVSCYRTNGVKWSNGCPWWDVSCILRYIFGYPYMGGTREPVYDESSYPSVLDWRTLGVVTEVNSQGACGACWAITAVETIESANAIATGQLIDLDEEEVIACDGTCEMCNGGWPQNAYEYVTKHGGLPAKTSDYNADWLYLITAVLAGESYDVSENQLGSYFSQTCPAGVREGDGGEASGNNDGDKSHHSGDDNSNEQYASSYVASTRYGKVKGYGYATDRCVCYTDGSGCDCDNQDEKTAVLNVASYGPAAVCLEASMWQNYEGGIMTSDIGCSSGFLDMNHCVEVVGYAFTDDSRSNSGSGENGGSRDDKSDKSGSRDSATREGYWIVKNQWSTYWGMSGYAYLAMGDNTCGILNDMTQVYMK